MQTETTQDPLAPSAPLPGETREEPKEPTPEEIKSGNGLTNVKAVKEEAPKKVSKLKGKDPKTAEPSRSKIQIFGPPGAGKTWGALGFPSVYYVDTEGGANLNHYTDRLKASGGAYFGPEDGSLDPKSLLEEVDALATEQHGYKTLVIDSLSKIFNKIIAEESERLGPVKDVFGASKKPAIAWMRKLLNRIGRIDMNVIIISHQKDVWGPDGAGKVGETFDGWDKLAYELDLSMQIVKQGESRKAIVVKSRLLGFPEGQVIPWGYEEFATRYGKNVIEKVAVPIVLATPDQVARVAELLEVVKISEDDLSKWFSKAGVESFAEMDSETIGKCISFLTGKVK